MLAIKSWEMEIFRKIQSYGIGDYFSTKQNPLCVVKINTNSHTHPYAKSKETSFSHGGLTRAREKRSWIFDNHYCSLAVTLWGSLSVVSAQWWFQSALPLAWMKLCSAQCKGSVALVQDHRSRSKPLYSINILVLIICPLPVWQC